MSRGAFEIWVGARWARLSPSRAAQASATLDVPYPMVAALGLAGETGEVMECLKKHYRDGKHPGEALKLELGDVLHYLTVIGAAYGWTLADIMLANIDKLEARDKEGK